MNRPWLHRAGWVLAATVAAGGVALAFTAFPERTVGGRANVSEATATQAGPWAASFPGGTWVVWTDRRRGANWDDVYGARVALDGGLLDPAGVPLVTDPLNQASPAVSCGPSTCLLSWQDTVAGARFALLSFDGGVGPPLDAGWQTGAYPLSAWNAGGALALWAEADGWHGLRLDLDGAPVAPEGLLVPSSLRAGRIGLAGSADRFLFAWLEDKGPDLDVWSAIFDADGGWVSGPTLRGNGAVPTPAVAVGTDGGFALAWVRGGATGLTIQVLRTDLDGNASGPPEVAASPLMPWGRGLALAERDDTLAVASAFSNTVAVAVSPFDGGWTHVTYAPTPGEISASGVPGGWVYAWSESGVMVREARVTTLAASMADGGQASLGRSAQAQRVPAARTDGRAFWAAWQDFDDGGARVWFAPLGPDGAPTALPDQLEAVPGQNDTLWLVHHDGRRAWVGWWATGVYNWQGTLRLTPVGGAPAAPVVLDPDLIFLDRVSAATGAGVTFVTWSHYTATTSNDLFFMRLDADGNPLEEPGSPLVAEPEYQTAPAVHFARGVFNVVYRQGGARERVVLRRWTPQGTPLDAAGAHDLVDLSISSSPVASGTDGDLVLVVWADSPGGGDRLLAARVAGTVVLDTAPLVLSENIERTPAELLRPTVVHDGTSFVVGWTHAAGDGGQQGRLRRVGADGTLGPLEVPLNGTDDADDFTLAAGSPGRVLALYGRHDPAQDAVRLRTRVLAEVPLGGFCTSNADCVSGECGGPVPVCCQGGVCPTPLPDGGLPGPDGGPGGPGPRRLEVACGCGALAGASPTAFLAAGLAVAWRRRRARRARTDPEPKFRVPRGGTTC